jgi:hypothetical protein
MHVAMSTTETPPATASSGNFAVASEEKANILVPPGGIGPQEIV